MAQGRRARCDCHVNIWNDGDVLPLYHQHLSRVRAGEMAPKADADTLFAEMEKVDRAIVFALGYGDSIGIQSSDETTAACVARYPVLFLFDEPLSNLDAKLRVQMRAEIKGLHQRLGTTTIYVTHDQVEAMTMADMIVVMRDGEIEQVGAPLDLYDQPRNQFVAGFIGSPSMNFLAGTMTDGGFRLTDGTMLPVTTAFGTADTCGVRPEHLRRDDAGVEIEAMVIEPTGSETQVVARLGGQSLVAVFRERIAIRPGDRLRVTADPAHMHMFDKNGLRLAGKGLPVSAEGPTKWHTAVSGT